MGFLSDAWDTAKGVVSSPAAQGALGVLTGGGSTLAGQAGGAMGLYNQAAQSKGGVAGMVPHASPSNPAAQYGTPRGGGQIDPNNFNLGNDPNYNAQFQQGQQDIGRQSQELMQAGQGIGAQGQALSQLAGGIGAQGTGLMSAGNAAGQRGAPVTSYGSAVRQLQSGSQDAGGQQYALANQLQTLASSPQGPSAAQAQLNMGTDQALNSQLAMARSGSGFGESSGAMANAQQNAAGLQSNAANQAAMLRANEDQAFRGRQLQALGMSGEALGQGRAADLALGQQQIGQSQFGTQTALSQQQMNDALRQGLIGQGLEAQNMGLSGQLQGINAQNQALASQYQGIDAQNQANQLALQAAQAQQQGTMNLENTRADVYGMDQQAHDRSRELNQQNSNNWIGGITGGIGALGSLASLSDRRSKKNVEHEELSRVYRALGGA